MFVIPRGIERNLPRQNASTRHHLKYLILPHTIFETTNWYNLFGV